IYCDFSGYSDLATGCAKWFGFELPQNFHFPYLARNIADFWRRWHMSLSFWIRDYLYFPLGGSRKGEVHACLNLMIVMTLCGCWRMQRALLGTCDATGGYGVPAWVPLLIGAVALGHLFSGVGDLRCRLLRLPALVRATAYVGAVVLVVAFGPGVGRTFVYFRF